DDEDPEEDLVDYPTDRYDDDKEKESSGDDADDEEEDEDEDEEDEEHLASIDSVAKILAIPTPPPSPLTSYLSPLPQIPSPPLPPSPTHPLGYRAAMIWLRAESPSTSYPLPLPSPITPPLLPMPLPTSLPPLLLPSSDHRADVPEVTLPPRKRGFRADYGFVGTLDAEIRRDPDREIGYRITNVWEDPYEITEEIPTNDVAKLSQRMIDFVTIVRQDTDEIYRRLDDVQDDGLLMSGQLNSLRRDRRSHARTPRLMKIEAISSCEAWVQSMDVSDTTRFE
nr:hypothetical protein [Tanacetum cinerariifolium]